MPHRLHDTKEQTVSLSTHSSHEFFDRHAAEAAMAWYGWGSPVGLGIAAVLIRFAVFGF